MKPRRILNNNFTLEGCRGDYTIYGMHGTQLISKRYIYYTQKEAIKMFRKELKTNQQQYGYKQETTKIGCSPGRKA